MHLKNQKTSLLSEKHGQSGNNANKTGIDMTSIHTSQIRIRFLEILDVSRFGVFFGIHTLNTYIEEGNSLAYD